jgi:hypothetical protein
MMSTARARQPCHTDPSEALLFSGAAVPSANPDESQARAPWSS